MFTSPLAVIPGKKDPKSLAAYLQRLMEDLKECGPSGGSHDSAYPAWIVFYGSFMYSILFYLSICSVRLYSIYSLGD